MTALMNAIFARPSRRSASLTISSNFRTVDVHSSRFDWHFVNFGNSAKISALIFFHLSLVTPSGIATSDMPNGLSVGPLEDRNSMALAAQAEIRTASNAGRRTLPMTTPVFFARLLRSCADCYRRQRSQIPAQKISSRILPQSGRVDHYCNSGTQRGVNAMSEACSLYPRKRALASVKRMSGLMEH